MDRLAGNGAVNMSVAEVEVVVVGSSSAARLRRQRGVFYLCSDAASAMIGSPLVADGEFMS